MKTKHAGHRAAALATAALSVVALSPAGTGARPDQHFETTTPVKHLVVIFQENVSFDHYFGTYPHATNPAGEPAFHAKNDTPRVNNLESSGLLTINPNSFHPVNTSGSNPFRIDRTTPNTCDQDHSYGDEQFAAHGGLMDRFTALLPNGKVFSCNDPKLGPNSVMGYYDGNTVTALWNYAQHFAMSDNSFGTSFGPSTPGLLNLVAGNTYAAMLVANSAAGNIAGGASSGAVIGDPDPGGDNCSAPTRGQITMTGKNVGDLLNEAGITWGSFMGGFANCAAAHTGITGLNSVDYIPHHAFFQYWRSTLNATHVGPSSPAMIGRTDRANHEYDLNDFWTAVQNHNLPAVSFLKAPAFEDGHAGYSDPLDEQNFLVNTINGLQQTEEWKETAVVILYDDSDGWYDHQMGPVIMQSNITDTSAANEDQLLGPGNCGTPVAAPGTQTVQNGRCGLGPRLPLLVISPWARRNYVDHRLTDQSSIIRFIEENWKLPDRIGNGSTDTITGRINGMFDFDDRDVSGRRLILDPKNGQVVTSDSDMDHGKGNDQ